MSKFIKKALAMVATLVMALAIATPALAATANGTIKIHNPTSNSTYTAYQIFEATEENGKVTYTLKNAAIKSKLLTKAVGGAHVENAEAVDEFVVDGLKFVETDANTGMYKVEKTTGYNAATFAATLKGIILDGLTDDERTSLGQYELNAAGKFTVTDVDGGYYLILQDDGDKPMLTTVLELTPGQTVVVENKNDMPFDKVIDGIGTGDETENAARAEGNKELAGINIGDTVYFTITGKVPDTREFDGGYLYKVSDTMDKGLTFNKDVVVKIGEQTITLTNSGDAEPTDDQIKYTDDGFVLSLNMKQYEGNNGDTHPQAGDTVVITYSAVVNENAHAVLSGNKARLEYSNDPNDWTKTDKVDDRVDVYTYDIVVDKFEAGEESQKLSGAKFKLYKEVANGGTKTKKYYKETKDATDTTKIIGVTWVDDANDATPVTTNENGAASFIGLESGTYYLEETAAPTGYKIRETPIEVKIEPAPAGIASLTEAEQSSLLTNVASVPNTPGENLPSTGGMGTTIFYLASAVVFAIIVMRVMRREQDQVA